jgi:hypothetical protein
MYILDSIINGRWLIENGKFELFITLTIKTISLSDIIFLEMNKSSKTQNFAQNT